MTTTPTKKQLSWWLLTVKAAASYAANTTHQQNLQYSKIHLKAEPLNIQ